MVAVIIISLLAGFGTGIVYSEAKHSRRKRARYDRRNEIIEKKWALLDRLIRWDIDHPILMLNTPKKGGMIFKGNSDKMTEEEYQIARRKGGRRTA